MKKLQNCLQRYLRCKQGKKYPIITNCFFCSFNFLFFLTFTSLASLSTSIFAEQLEDQSTFADIMLLKVAKDNYEARLSTLPAHGETPKMLYTFNVAFGKEKGDKEKEGDNKTPEGIYFIENHIDTMTINPEKYGQIALPLNFPNPVDLKQNKTGHGIWLHGAGNDDRMKEENVTEGCIAFYNAEILKLKDWLKPYKGIVAISKNFENINRKEDQKEIYENTNKWLTAWKQKNIDEYIDLYHDQFSNKRQSKSQYEKYKQRVFSSYKKMDVEANFIRVITHPKYAVSIMKQYFNGDNRYVSTGRKILYWMKSDNRWKIISEYYDQKNYGPIFYNSESMSELAKYIKSRPI